MASELDINLRFEHPEPGTTQVADTVAWEHSPPGTGPIPVYPNLQKDKAVANGWRRDSPPAAFED